MEIDVFLTSYMILLAPGSIRINFLMLNCRSDALITHNIILLVPVSQKTFPSLSFGVFLGSEDSMKIF